MRNRHLYITLLTLLGLNLEAVAQPTSTHPKLIVCITIEQLRSDLVEDYSSLYTSHGLRRLLTEGLVYKNASYDFKPVDRASAIASVYTGTVPYYNGITSLEYLDRNSLNPIGCVKDFTPANLTTSTIGDELKIATKGIAKVFSFSPTPDTSILSAGHAADGAMWIENDKWHYSTYYIPINNWINGFTRLNSPTSNTNKSITNAATACIEQAGIGLDDKTDLVNIIYTLPPQMEEYVALDQQISILLSKIEARLKSEDVLIVLSSTGYNYEEESEIDKYRIPTGKFNINRTANLLNMYLCAIYGQAQYVEATFRNQVFLNHQILKQKNIHQGDILKHSQDFLLQVTGVRNVYTSYQLLTSDSHIVETIRNGYNVEKSGDLIIDIAPGWQLVNENSNRIYTSRSSYIPFPIIFWGCGISSQKVNTPVTADRIAPTIARIIRIRAPNACSTKPLF